MNASETSIPTGLDRVKGLIAWWGISNVLDSAQVEAEPKQYQLLVVDLVKLFDEAAANQAQLLSAANEQFTRAFQELLRARRPPELMAAQSSLVIAFLESLAAQNKIWAELAQKVCACGSIVIGDAEVEACKHSGHSEPVSRPAKADPSIGNQGSQVMASGSGTP